MLPSHCIYLYVVHKSHIHGKVIVLLLLLVIIYFKIIFVIHQHYIYIHSFIHSFLNISLLTPSPYIHVTHSHMHEFTPFSFISLALPLSLAPSKHIFIRPILSLTSAPFFLYIPLHSVYLIIYTYTYHITLPYPLYISPVPDLSSPNSTLLRRTPRHTHQVGLRRESYRTAGKGLGYRRVRLLRLARTRTHWTHRHTLRQ